MNLTESINQYIKENRISKAALGRAMGIKLPNLCKRLKNQDMTVSFVVRLSKVLDYNFLESDNSNIIEELKREIEILKREKELLTDLIRGSMK